MKKLYIFIVCIAMCEFLPSQSLLHDKKWYENGLDLLEQYDADELATDYFFKETVGDKNNEWVLIGQGVCYARGIGVEKNTNEALRKFKKSAGLDNCEAYYNLGLYHLYGDDIIGPNEKKAMGYLATAAEKGSSRAMMKLYDIYGKKNDNKQKKAYLIQAANQGVPLAQYLYAVILEEENNYYQADELYKKAAATGEPNALNVLGEKYEKAGNAEDAFKFYKESSDNGCMRGKMNLGRCYHYGIGVTADTKKAGTFYSVAAQSGDNEAQYLCGKWFEDEALGAKENLIKRDYCYKSAFEWYYKSAEQGNTDANYRLGRCYEYGYGVEKSIIHANNCYSKASKDNAKAKVRLGHCYEKGDIDLDRDLKKAYDYYQEAYQDSKQNSDKEALSMAAYYLGAFYEKGYVVEKNKNKAIEYYTESANEKNKDAAYSLYLLYTKNKNDKLANEWFNKALLYEHDKALCIEGKKLFEKNENDNQCEEYFKKAAEENNPDAYYYLGKIYRQKDKYDKSLKSFVNAVENGNKNAAFEIGKLYQFKYNKLGVNETQSIDNAMKWYYIGAYMTDSRKGSNQKQDNPETRYNNLAKDQGKSPYKPSYKIFRKFFINNIYDEWRKREKIIETDNECKIRVERDSKNKQAKLQAQALSIYINKVKGNFNKSFKIGDYDNNHMTYKFTSSTYGDFIVKIDRNIAAEENFLKDYRVDAEYSIWYDNTYETKRMIAKLAVKYKNNVFYSDVKEKYDTKDTLIIIDPSTDHVFSDVDVQIPVTENKDPSTYVLIIGNGSGYTDVPKIDFVNNDVRVFKTYCENALGIVSSNIVSVENVNSSEMLGAVKKFRDKLKDKKRTNVIVYYSGHGISINGRSYLIPVDCSYNSRLNIELNEISQIIRSVNPEPERMTFFVDACFDGSSKNGGNLRTTKGVVKLEPIAKPLEGNTVVFYATQTTAILYKDEKHGLFTYYLLKAIKDNVNISYRELSKYLSDNVKNKAKELDENNPQEPVTVPNKSNVTGWENWKLIR